MSREKPRQPTGDISPPNGDEVEPEGSMPDLYGHLYKEVGREQVAVVTSLEATLAEERRLTRMFEQISGPFDSFDGTPLRALSDAKALLGIMGFSVDDEGVILEKQFTTTEESNPINTAWVRAQTKVRDSGVFNEFKNLVALNVQYRKALKDLSGKNKEEEIRRLFTENKMVQDKSRYVVETLKEIAKEVYGSAGQEASERANKAFLETEQAQKIIDEFPELGRTYEALEPTVELAKFLCRERMIWIFSGINESVLSSTRQRLKSAQIRFNKDQNNDEIRRELDYFLSQQKMIDFKLKSATFLAEQTLAKLDEITSELSDKDKIAFFEGMPKSGDVELYFGERYARVEAGDSELSKKLSDEKKKIYILEMVKSTILRNIIQARITQKALIPDNRGEMRGQLGGLAFFFVY